LLPQAIRLSKGFPIKTFLARLEVNILEESPVSLLLTPRRSERRRMLREQHAAASSGDALDFLYDQLAQARFSGPDFQLEGTVVDDFQGDPSAKPGMNDVEARIIRRGSCHVKLFPNPRRSQRKKCQRIAENS
jgi:hypothetical protein